MSAGFSRVEALIDAFIGALTTTHALIGLGVLVVVGAQITVVMCGLYMRPQRNIKQLLKLLLILFAALVLCSMTLWLLWELAMA
jgi:hypothetical protein